MKRRRQTSTTSTTLTTGPAAACAWRPATPAQMAAQINSELDSFEAVVKQIKLTFE